MPYFSVIIPLFNKEKYIFETLNSVLNQSFQDFEVIIINDGSTDDSLEVVRSFSDPRIRVIDQENLGLSKTRNRGIVLSKSDLITFIDADDLWLPNHLDQLNNLIQSYPDSGLYATGYSYKYSDIKIRRARFFGLPKGYRGLIPNYFLNSLTSSVAWIGAICIPKKVFNHIGNFDTELYSEQDTDLYIRIGLSYNIALDDTFASAIYNKTVINNMSIYENKNYIPKFLNSYLEKEKELPELKKFMDYNRFSTLIFYKLSNNKALEKKLLGNINPKQLTLYQRVLLKLPNPCLKFLYTIKNKLHLNSEIIFKP